MQRIAASSGCFGRSPPLFIGWRSRLRTWRRRARERAELARMSDAELHDIGISSTDRWAEINKPFWRK